jgi:Fe-S cluster assembly protein SufD
MNGSKLIADTLQVPDKALVEELILISFDGSSKKEFRAGASSRSRVLVDYDAPKQAEELTLELYLESGACVDVFHLLEGIKKQAPLKATVRYHLKKHASLNVWAAIGSCEQFELQQEVLFIEEHGFASLRGIAVLNKDARLLHKVKADHGAAHCVSRQFFKSILADRAVSGFESLVRVQKGAVKSDSKQLNKNLLLSREARGYSRPELRIHTDDVSCAHGSATGELSEEELFYLRSRGINEERARSLMIAGFAAETLEGVSPESVKDRLEGLLRKRIAELL